MKLNTAPVTSSQPPHSSAGARTVSVRRGAAGEPQPRHQAEQRRRQQPGRLGAHRLPRTAGRCPDHRRTPGCPRPHRAAVIRHPLALAADDAAEAVVAEGQFQQAVVGGAADIGPGGRRPEARPSPGTSPRTPPSPPRGRQQLPRRLPSADRRGHQEHQREPGHRAETPAASWSGTPKPTAHPASAEPPGAALSGSRAPCSTRPPRAAVPAARRGCCSGTSAPPPASGPAPAPAIRPAAGSAAAHDRVEQQGDGGHAHQRLRQQHA